MTPENGPTRPSTLTWVLGLGAAAVACLFCVGALGLALIVAGNSPQLQAWLASPTPSRTPTPRATSTPAATSTPPPSPTPTPDTAATQAADVDALLERWPVVWDETFSRNTVDWYTGEYEDDFGTAAQQLDQGKMRWEITAKQGALWWDAPDQAPTASDFTLTLDAEKLSGASDADWGVLFRVADDDNFYYFALGEEFYAFFLLQDNEWRTLIDWSATPALQSAGVNTVAVNAEGALFRFFINGQLVDRFEDDTLPRGAFGLAVSFQAEGDEGVFEFDNLRVHAP